MKRVLFVLPSVGLGGTATSLLNLLSLWDNTEYKADLFLLMHDGPFLPRAKILGLIPEDRLIASVLCPKHQLKARGLCATLIRYAFTVARRLFGATKTTHWFYRRSARKLSGKYDVVVAYQESQATEYAQYIEAPVRVAWCHMDYRAFSAGKSVAKQASLYDKYRAIACVSEVGKASMLHYLNLPESKVEVVYNTIPPHYIKETAQEDGEAIETRPLTFVSCGRFVRRKRFDRVVKAAAALRDKGLDFIWYILGNGETFAEIDKLVREHNLINHVILTGAKSNPFPYIDKADCFVMASENEGQPMVLNEAMTLKVPVITTDFPSAREVVTNGVNGLITPNTDDGLTQTVMTFATDETVRNSLKQGVSSFVYDNESIIQQILRLISNNREEKTSCQ